MTKNPYRFVFAAGGTGGHLYPAIAVAEKIKELKPSAEILFVGTKNKIEARVVPNLGFDFKTIWISGFSRKLTFKNLLFPIKLIVSIVQSFFINLKLKPKVAIGAGAYVSAPIAITAKMLGSKITLLEQNSYPGVTNRMLEKKADRVHLSFEDSKKYFKEQEKLVLSGNPIRNTLQLTNEQDAKKSFDLDLSKKTLLVLGGSLGARTINNSIKNNLSELIKNDIQIIWQTGELYYDEFKRLENKDVKVMAFISDMAKAYSACDLLLARAGATTIAEVAYLGLPVIFVPSKNVAANHQYKNAKSLVDVNAGLLIEDDRLEESLSKAVIDAIKNEKLLSDLKQNIRNLAKPDAAKNIALDVIKLAEQN